MQVKADISESNIDIQNENNSRISFNQLRVNVDW